MLWNPNRLSFLRPVHSSLCLFSKLIPVLPPSVFSKSRPQAPPFIVLESGRHRRLPEVAEKLNSARKRIRAGFEGLKDFDPTDEAHPRNIGLLIKEELSSAEKAILTGITRIDKGMNHDSSAFKQLKLEFQSKIPVEILTGLVVKGEGDVPIEVALINVSIGEIVDVGLEASLCVEIVLLKEGSDASEGDDWFEKNIIRDKGGNKSLLSGDMFVKLQNGIGVVINIKFIH